MALFRKYKDAHVMNQFKALSMESEGEGDDDYDGHLVVRTRAVSSDSEEEIFTTEPRGYEGLEIWSDGRFIVLLLGLVQILVIWYLLRKKRKKKKKK